jgi:hypothetical protein
MASKYPFDPNDPYRYLLNLEEEDMIEETENDIRSVCEGLAAMLIEKNRAYGDSALSPRRIFSRADALEQINVRIDDKLSRIANIPEGQLDSMGEDPERDLLGYLVLKLVGKMRKARNEEFAKRASQNQAAPDKKRTLFGAPIPDALAPGYAAR